MGDRYNNDVSSWLQKPGSSVSSYVQVNVGGVPFYLSAKLLAKWSAKVAALLESNSAKDLTYLLPEIPADPKIFEHIARFCYGYELRLSSENVIAVACVAKILGMDETRSSDNLFKIAVMFFKQNVLCSWNESIKALLGVENVLKYAVEYRFVHFCSETIISKALIDPRLLGEPINNPREEVNNNRLYSLGRKSEDLTMLSLQFYEHIIYELRKRGMPSQYIAESVCQYASRWVLEESQKTSIFNKRKTQKDVIEAVERLLPQERGLIPCSVLFEMLHCAVLLDASLECLNGFETRIGKQLHRAHLKDLKVAKHDVQSLRRILTTFCKSYMNCDILLFLKVAKLLEEFLGEVASEADMETKTFTSLAEISAAASAGLSCTSDGLYTAIDIYLETHKNLTASEKEEVCGVLELENLSTQACEHVAKNERLPLRLVVQAMFVLQTRLRDTVAKQVKEIEEESIQAVEEQHNDDDCYVTHTDLVEEEVERDMAIMSNKMTQLEEECHSMRQEIEKTYVKKGKVSIWRAMKNKFGCMTGIQRHYDSHAIKNVKKITRK